MPTNKNNFLLLPTGEPFWRSQKSKVQQKNNTKKGQVKNIMNLLQLTVNS